MEPRLDVKTIDPEAIRTLLGFSTYLSKSGLDRRLANLVALRASQINGCAYCIDMHTKDLRAEGESEQRLYLLDAWRDAPFYSDQERAALAWTEAVTRLAEKQVPDSVYQEVRRFFSEKELISLTMAVVAINSWNRMNIAFQTVAGDYQPSTAVQHRTTSGS
jgi:AhpD family alkylhydroperoxidase